MSGGHAAYPGVGEAAGTDLAAAHEHLRSDALALLRSWPAPDPSQEAARTDFVDHLVAQPVATAKAGPPAHLTASCLVLSEDGAEVLLTHHRRARLWFQFGGHLEADDASVYAAATRECREESGMADLVPWPQPVHLNRHVLSGDFGRCREHLDVRFAAVAPRGAQPVTSAESLDVRWWPVAALPPSSPDELRELIAAARRSLGGR